MYYLKLDNRLDRTIEKTACNFASYIVNDFLVKNFVYNSNDAETIIYKNLEQSFFYAENIILGRFKKGEPIIAKNPKFSYNYAIEIIKGRFELGEEAISKYASYSYFYAKNVLKDRFYLGEPIIKNSEYKQSYEKYFGIEL